MLSSGGRVPGMGNDWIWLVGVWPLRTNPILVRSYPKTKFSRNFFRFLVVSQNKNHNCRSIGAWLEASKQMKFHASNSFKFCKHFLYFNVDLSSSVLIYHSGILFVCSAFHFWSIFGKMHTISQAPSVTKSHCSCSSGGHVASYASWMLRPKHFSKSSTSCWKRSRNISHHQPASHHCNSELLERKYSKRSV